MKQYARAGDNVRVVGLLSYSKSCEVINLKEKISVQVVSLATEPDCVSAFRVLRSSQKMMEDMDFLVCSHKRPSG